MVWWQFIDITATTPDQITISYASIHTVPAYSVVLVLMLHIIMKKVTWQRKEGGNWKKKLVGWYCWRKRTLGPFKMEEEENERDFFLSSFFFHIFWCDDVKEIKKPYKNGTASKHRIDGWEGKREKLKNLKSAFIHLNSLSLPQLKLFQRMVRHPLPLSLFYLVKFVFSFFKKNGRKQSRKKWGEWSKLCEKLNVSHDLRESATTNFIYMHACMLCSSSSSLTIFAVLSTESRYTTQQLLDDDDDDDPVENDSYSFACFFHASTFFFFFFGLFERDEDQLFSLFSLSYFPASFFSLFFF